MNQNTGNLSKHLSIHAASKACGLSPSVLRIWELRYGWPNPARRPNGYRAYSRHLIEDLKRVAKMVQEGTPISEIIIDGMPSWPQEPETVDAPKRTVEATRALPRPGNRNAIRLQDHVYSALEQRSGGQIQEILQRASWELRPQEENLVVLTPAVMGLLEQLPKEKEVGPGEERIFTAVLARARQLLARFPVQGPEVLVAATKPKAPAMAAIVALAMRQRGINALPWLEEDPPQGDYVPVKVQNATKRRSFAIVVGEEGLPLNTLFESQEPLPWQDKHAAA